MPAVWIVKALVDTLERHGRVSCPCGKA
ncbi:Protein TOS1 [Gossypium arboreum]|uniref:Protein TOS1 n=1 Tax=Gossypium arboreum TaxID=29729 RepID=A0A0B0PI13_GOSAR|nr:Protein TOS1 [Gossypium arboreum]